MENKTIRFEYAVGDISTILAEFVKAWNENPATKLGTTSYGRTGNPDGLHFFEAELIPLTVE